MDDNHLETKVDNGNISVVTSANDGNEISSRGTKVGWIFFSVFVCGLTF